MPRTIECANCGLMVEVDGGMNLAELACPECRTRLGKRRAAPAAQVRQRRRTSGDDAVNWRLLGGAAVATVAILSLVYAAFFVVRGTAISKPQASAAPPDDSRPAADKPPPKDSNSPMPVKGASEQVAPSKEKDDDDAFARLSRGELEFNYAERRSKFRTTLSKRGPAPHSYDNSKAPPPGVKLFNYTSEGRELKAWIYAPPGTEKKQNPAFVFLHAGFAFNMDDFAATKPFMDRGYIVLCPTYRGENGNPGDFELFLGETDDAAEAVRHLSRQSFVDPKRIYVLGHGEGGAIAGNLSLLPDVPAVHTASVGGLYSDNNFFNLMFDLGIPPFEFGSGEKMFRQMLGNLEHMKRRHIGYIGTADEAFRSARVAADYELPASQRKLKFVSVPGDLQQSLEHGIQKYLKLAESGE
jgi:acetyl esterase/lipase